MRKKLYAAALVVAVMGLVLPGCSWFGGDEHTGRICASPKEGGEYCVRSSWDPAGAWGDAAAHGTEPIQMWAEWPEETAIDDLVKSRDALDRWFQDIDKAMQYVRSTKGSAESYRASLDGKMGQLLREVRGRQTALLSEQADPAADFKGALAAKADAEKGPLVAEIALDKQAMGEVTKILDAAGGEIEPLAKRYANLASAFSDYRATESTEAGVYKNLAQDASKASLDELTPIEQSILKAGQDASAAPNDLMLEALKLSADLQQIALSSHQSLDPHVEFMTAQGASIPDMTSGALRSIDAMLGYMEKRVVRSDATAKNLIIGVGMRRKALEMLDASAPLRQEVAEAKLASAGASFADTAKGQVDAVQEALPMSLSMGVPYLSRRYDALTAVLQMKPLCTPSSSSWREAGCVSLRARFDDTTTALQTTLPKQIATGLVVMKAAGVNAALLDMAKAKLDAGDIKGAAVLHDAALRVAEGT